MKNNETKRARKAAQNSAKDERLQVDAMDSLQTVPDAIEADALGSEYIPGLTEESCTERKSLNESDPLAAIEVPEEIILSDEFPLEDQRDAHAEPVASDPSNPIIRICTSRSIPSATLGHARDWEEKSMSFDELCDILSHPIVTLEAFADYCEWDELSREKKTSENKEAVEKAAKDKMAAKDRGGFIGGYFKSLKEKRSIENVAARSLWTADCDHCTPECFEAIESMIPFLASIDTSHSHSKIHPHFRVTAPLNRECSPEEYRVMSIQLNRELNEKMLEFQLECEGVTDESQLEQISFTDKSLITDPARIIFWTSHSADGEFFHKKVDGPLINVDEVLQRYAADMKDAEKQHKNTRRKNTQAFMEARDKNIAYANPCDLPGIEGLFNRAYTIRDVLEADHLLKGVYIPSSDPNRWTYSKGSSQRGLAIVNDRCAFSHHATDTANNGKPLSPFWLVCIHKYGEDKKAALKALESDKGILAQRAKERALANNVQNIRDQFPIEDNTWTAQLKINEKGEYIGTAANCATILEHDPLFANFAKNEMSGKIEITGPLPWKRKEPELKRAREIEIAKMKKPRLNEDDRAQCVVLLDKFYAAFSPWTFENALRAVTDSRKFHPLREWIENLPAWDGKPRIADLLPNAFKAERSEYTAAVMRKTLCAMIAKAYNPFIEFQYVPVLDGKQGIGKSSFWRWLIGPRFFMDSLTLNDMQSKAAVEKIQGYAAAEIAEFAGMKKADQEIVKGFITAYSDVFRPAYGHDTDEKARSCILLGTVNGERGFLRDVTGGRRWWEVKCLWDGRRIWDKIYDDEDQIQIWAEALSYYDAGEKLEMDTLELREAAEKAQQGAMEFDDRRGLIERFLEMKLPKNWDEKKIEHRRDYIKMMESQYDGEITRDTVCTMEIYLEVLDGEPGKMDRKIQSELAQIMKSLPEWEYTGKLERVPQYGPQRCYKRKQQKQERPVHIIHKAGEQYTIRDGEPPLKLQQAESKSSESLTEYLKEKISEAFPQRKPEPQPQTQHQLAREPEDVSKDFENEHERDKKLAQFATHFLCMNDLSHEASEIVQKYAEDFNSLKSEDFLNVFSECEAIIPPQLRGKWRAGIDKIIQ